MEEKMKYNPFKMWGSYVGVVISIIIIAGFLQAIQGTITQPEITGETIVDYYIGYRFCFFGCSDVKWIDLPDYNFGQKYTIGEPDPSIGFAGGHKTVPKLAQPLYILYSLIIIVIGFLVGWGIHSIIRKIRS